MSDDDYDDELPQILVNSSCRDSNDFSMPTADVLASQRAREEECEAELRQLRSQYEKQFVRLTSTESSSSESEGSLAAAVDALSVVSWPTDLPPTAADLVYLLATNLATYNTEFLPSYLEILQTSNEDLIRIATNEIAETIECILVDMLECNKQRSDVEIVVMTSWLWAASMWRSPRVPGLRRLLQAMLALATPHQVEQVAGAVCAAGAALRCAGALVRAADAAAPHALSARARAAALRLLAPPPPPSPPSAHQAADEDESSVQHVCARLSGAWRGLSAGERLAALQLAGRARWPGGGAAGAERAERAARAALRDLLALVAQSPPAQLRHSPDYLQVVVGASKLQILFQINS